MRERKWLLLTLYGLLITIAVSNALKAIRPKFKIATTSTTTTEDSPSIESIGNEDEVEVTTFSDTNATTGHILTGIPQIDYIWDPNLPRELNGYNLSDYPFYSSIPEDIDFKCDGLHDGFYASVPHKCQVYHHCLFGTRYDFLCANFTAFDQKTFICHFVSEVDCTNSKKYWHRNDALYKVADSTTTSTVTTSTTTTSVTPVQLMSNIDKGDRLLSRERDLILRRRRPPMRRPVYDYYDEDYYDDDAYERTRPRGYPRREYDDYEDRKYRRDRDRIRDYRHRDFRERDRETPLRDRLLIRGNRRDPIRMKDPNENEPLRPRLKDQDFSKSHDSEERIKDGDERRYFDKKIRDDYDEKIPELVFNSGNNEGLIKPAAPPTSVFARPRIPPKLRRPVPLAEQDKYAYSTNMPFRSLTDESRRKPITEDTDESRKKLAIDDLEQPRRRPIFDSLEELRRKPADIIIDDYYEDEIEDIRPRWQMRGRPLRDRDFLDKRYRDRHFRSRYRDDNTEIRLRKYLDRSRDRFYEREWDRGLERGHDRSLDRTKERKGDYDQTEWAMRVHNFDKLDKPSIYNRPIDLIRENERSHTIIKDHQEVMDTPKRSNQMVYDRNTEKVIISSKSEQEKEFSNHTIEESKNRLQKYSFLTMKPKLEVQQQQEHEQKYFQIQSHKIPEITTEKEFFQKYWKSKMHGETHNREKELFNDYSSEYYDDIEEPAIIPLSLIQPTVRIIKRPFLPSRGGNPNPRGLLPVGSKAQTSRQEENPLKHYIRLQTTTTSYLDDDCAKDVLKKDYHNQSLIYDNKHTYNNYKNLQQSEVNNNYNFSESKPIVHRLKLDITKNQTEIQSQLIPHKTLSSWTTNYKVQEQESEAKVQGNEQQVKDNIQYSQNHNTKIYNLSYKNDEIQDQLSVNGNLKVKQKINEVTHHNLQDIPESEYDVTLNEALTPNVSQEPSMPSGFVLPSHPRFGKDPILQSSENINKYSTPFNQQHQQLQQEAQHQLQQQIEQTKLQSAFGFNTQLEKSLEITKRVDKRKPVYFRTPDIVKIYGKQFK
ncbi:PREDICTED: uncharacterized protein LOC105366670 [Ceratosolen solmsi marchali]|uniref:Uncharacterized protein LOC105366670 n=1 Tax=Ceratosolen solmsi marchali TaxID=326594 RepID=A0AAJ7E0T6_9HYME|nr:PREDICTED: uncharacterized protein LOC105366670 [Ceratosolen solmsi marchali]